VGYLTGRELGSAFASADAFIFPSRTETLGLVLLEAMASGCPVVASRSGGITDIVTDGVNGYLFDPGSDDSGAIFSTQRLLEQRKNEKSSAKRPPRSRTLGMGSWHTPVAKLLSSTQQSALTSQFD
jgi:glycosyltransferase involved in cell wall biosynthesis